MEGERDVEGVAAGVPVSRPEVKSGEYCANASIVAVVVEEGTQGTQDDAGMLWGTGEVQQGRYCYILGGQEDGRRSVADFHVLPHRGEAPGGATGAGAQGRRISPSG